MANALIAFTLANAACELVTPIRYARTMTLWSRGRGDCGETAKIGAVCGYLIQIAATFTWYELAVLGIIPGGASDGTVDFELRLIHQMFTYVTFGAVFAIWLDDLAVVGACEEDHQSPRAWLDAQHARVVHAALERGGVADGSRVGDAALQRRD